MDPVWRENNIAVIGIVEVLRYDKVKDDIATRPNKTTPCSIRVKDPLVIELIIASIEELNVDLI